MKHDPARAQGTRHAPTPPHATKERKPLLNPLRDSSHFTNQAVAPLESLGTQKEAVPSSSRWDRFAVREGGVEPPRPCGHWNLNPARLPIPPPAHWVCPRALPFRCWRLPTSRRLARWRGWVHIPYPWPPRPRITVNGATSGGRTPAPLRHVSTSAGSRINLVPVPAISTGGGQGPRSGAGHWSRAASTILGRVRAGEFEEELRWEAGRGPQWASAPVTPADGADRGNQPISRRVDTISKQYGRSTQSGDDGGGAPWES